ncbi:MAG: amino acid ABC transporter substrate-binding protein [Deltaproteobacteria bacterium]|nr:amino acid ABC transporter substrate-binding protein [Deltaproteobacteria bacterium]
MSIFVRKSKAIVYLFLITLAIGVPRWSVAQQSIRIGASMSLTGKYALQGGYGREGYLLYQKHVNEKGGVLGRSIEFVIYDDRSDEKTAVRLYEKLIAEDKVDAVMGPYGSPITDAVADVTEKHLRLMVAPNAATTSLWEKGRRYLVMVLSPLEALPEGVLDLAARNGLQSLALINDDALVGKAMAKAVIELAQKKRLQLVFSETYPKGTVDFSAILNKVKAAKPDVLVAAPAASLVEDAVAITRQMRELDVNVKMFSSPVYGAHPDYYKRLEKSAEFAYSAGFWEPGLRSPGNQEFVAAYEKEFNRASGAASAIAYAGCQLFVEAARQAGSVDSDKLREALLKLRTRTLLGDFAIDERGFQIAHKAITIQWQDGKQVVVWPDELVSGKPRFPTPPWSQR